jgi:hypothetical protein
VAGEKARFLRQIQESCTGILTAILTATAMEIGENRGQGRKGAFEKRLICLGLDVHGRIPIELKILVSSIRFTSLD